MSLVASTYGMDESRRKRNIQEVADAEKPPDPSRLRVLAEDQGRTEYQYSSDSDSDFSSVEEKGLDKGDTRDSSFEHGDAEAPARAESTTVKRQILASLADPQSWEEASQADRLLFTMKTQGMSWDEIAKSWTKETGYVTTHSLLSDRYNRLKDSMQSLKEGDSDRLLAAVIGVKAAFDREKWSLVKFAMGRAGAADYSEAFIRYQYKRLVRTSHTDTTSNKRGEEADKSKGASMKDLQVSHPAQRPVEAIKPTAYVSPYDDTKLAKSATLSKSTSQTAKESQDIKREPQKEDAACLPKVEGFVSVNGQASVKPGTLPHNAIVVDDADPVPPSPVNTVPRSGQLPSLTASRIGSATNRGPARFTSIHKVVDDKGISKEKDALKPLPASPGLKPSNVSADPSRGGFGMLKNQRLAQHELPSKFEQRPEGQQNPLSTNDTPQTHTKPPQADHMLVGLPPMFAQTSGMQQRPITQSPVPHEAPKETTLTKPLAYRKPSDDGTTFQNAIPQQPPIQSIEDESQNKGSTTGTSVDTQEAGEKPTKPVTTNQLKYMLRHRTSNGANRNKTWDVIAHECGVTATLVEISAALEQALYPCILNTSVPSPSAVSTAPTPVAQSLSNGTSRLPAPRSRTPPATKTPAPPAAVPPQRPPDPGTPVVSEVLTVPSREVETPAPATTPSLDATPSTRSKRGRPPGSKNKEKDQVREERSMSPSQTNPTGSSMKRSAASKAAQSAAMRAAWARRKARAADALLPKPSTATAQEALVDSSVASFAAGILAAAAKRTSPAPTAAARYKSFDDEPVDLLTGESMFAQHSDDTPTAQTPSLPAAKKVVRRNISSAYASTVQNQPATKEPEEIDAMEEGSKESIRGPSQVRADGKTHKARTYPCPKCHKVYTSPGGRDYHAIKHPDCDKELPRPDRRTDRPDHDALRELESPTWAANLFDHKAE